MKRLILAALYAVFNYYLAVVTMLFLHFWHWPYYHGMHAKGPKEELTDCGFVFSWHEGAITNIYSNGFSLWLPLFAASVSLIVFLAVKVKRWKLWVGSILLPLSAILMWIYETSRL